MDPPGEEEDDDEDEEFAGGHSRSLRSRVRFSRDIDIQEFTVDTPPSFEDETTQVGLLYVIDEEYQEWNDDETAEGVEDEEGAGEADSFEGDDVADGEAEVESDAEKEAVSDADAEVECEAASETETEATEAEATLEASQLADVEEQPKMSCRASQWEPSASEKLEDDLSPLMMAKEAPVLAAEDAYSAAPVDTEEPEPEAELGSVQADLLRHALKDNGIDDLKLRLPSVAAADTTDVDMGDKKDEYGVKSERDRHLLPPLDSEKRWRMRHDSPRDRWPKPDSHSPLSPDVWPFNAASSLSLPPSRSDGSSPDCEAAFGLYKQDVEARLAQLYPTSSSSSLQPFDPRGDGATTLDKMTPLLRLSGARKDELERKCNMTEARIEDFARLVRHGMNGRLARAIIYHAGRSVGYQMESLRQNCSHSHPPWTEKLGRCEPILHNVRDKMGALQNKLTKERKGAQSLGPHLVLRIVEAAYYYATNERARRNSGASTLSSASCSSGASTLSGSRSVDGLQGFTSSLSSSSLRLAGAGLSLGTSTTVATGWHQSRWLACIVRAGVQASNRAIHHGYHGKKRSLTPAEGQELADQARLMAEWIEHWPTHVFPKNPRPRLPWPPRQLQICH